uniref:Ribosomal protein S16 n=1 Tax=Elaeagnus mollis TaxID=1642857 RepID=A0A856X6U2_9ROSA|nr:ribosomal protein S16 [Elaeagnus mollis]
MFDPEEKEEIFEKWVFMIRERIKPILMFLLFYIFLKKGAQSTGTVHDISKKAGVFNEFRINHEIKLMK